MRLPVRQTTPSSHLLLDLTLLNTNDANFLLFVIPFPRLTWDLLHHGWYLLFPLFCSHYLNLLHLPSVSGVALQKLWPLFRESWTINFQECFVGIMTGNIFTSTLQCITSGLFIYTVYRVFFLCSKHKQLLTFNNVSYCHFN